MSTKRASTTSESAVALPRAVEAIAAVIMFILIITIPFGIQALKLGVFALWPFGRTVIKREDAGAPSFIGNLLWLILAGWWLAIGHLITGILLAITIIGIPLALA